MIKKTVYVPFLLMMTLSVNLGLSSCKDKKKEETTTTTTVPGSTVDTVTAAPVIVNADDILNKNVADATKDFPTVKTDVKDGVVTLTGEIKRADLQKLMMSLNQLHPKKIENQLIIK